MADESITGGVGPKEFGPSPGHPSSVCRLVHRFAGEPEPSSRMAFEDVPEGTWYEAPISWMRERHHDGHTRPRSPRLHRSPEASWRPFLYRLKPANRRSSRPSSSRMFRPASSTPTPSPGWSSSTSPMAQVLRPSLPDAGHMRPDQQSLHLPARRPPEAFAEGTGSSRRRCAPAELGRGQLRWATVPATVVTMLQRGASAA